MRARLAIVLGLGAACVACGAREAPRRGSGAGGAGVGGAGAAGAAGAEEAVEAVPAPLARELAPVPPVIAPHNARVVRVAVTDAGDAALSVDALGEVRLWPALDGTREPIVVRAAAPRQLALGRVAGELVAALVDPAGGGEVLRHDAGGALVGRVQLPIEPAIEQLAIAGGTVLARRGDQTIAGYSVRGAVRGRLVPGRGQRLTTLAVRGAEASAGLAAEPGDGARALRWIVLDGGALAWGPTVALPTPLHGLALAPGGHAVAGLAGEEAQVVALEPRLEVVATLPPPPPGTSDLASIGFLDEDHAMRTTRAGSQSARRTDGGWAIGPQPARSPDRADTPAAFGDGVAIVGHGGGLTFAGDAPRHLGYRDGGAGWLSAGAVLLQRTQGRLVWLDGGLRARRTSEPTEAPSMRELVMNRALGDRHLAIVDRLTDRAPYRRRVAIRDVEVGGEVDVVTADDVAALEYDRGTRVLAVRTDGGTLRYRIGLAPVSAQALRKATAPRGYHEAYLTDPALAGGVVMVHAVNGRTAIAYAAPDEAAGQPLVERGRMEVRGRILHVDRAGRVYSSDGASLAIDRDGKRLGALAVRSVHAVAANEDATSVAALLPDELVMLAPDGTVRWRRAVPQAVYIAWSPEGQLVVSTHGGAVAFDAASPERAAAACGWNFGVHAGLSAITPISSVPSACAGE